MAKYFNKKQFLAACNKAVKTQEEAIEKFAIMNATATEVANSIEVANKELKEANKKAKEAMYASL